VVPSLRCDAFEAAVIASAVLLVYNALLARNSPFLSNSHTSHILLPLKLQVFEKNQPFDTTV
jgi:hypothetical protein